MKFLHDAWSLTIKDLRSYCRDRVALLLGFLMPIALMTVFGLVMAYAFGQSGGAPKISISVLDLDQSQASAALVESLADSQMLKVSVLQSETTSDADSLRSTFSNGDLHHALVIDSGFAEAINKREVPSLRMFRDPGRSLEDQIIQISIAQALIGSANSELIMTMVGNAFQTNGLNQEQWTSLRESFDQSSRLIENFMDGGNLSFEPDKAATQQSNGDLMSPGASDPTAENAVPEVLSTPESDVQAAESNSDETSDIDPMQFLTSLLPIENVDIQPPNRDQQVTYQQAQSISGVSVMMVLFGLVGTGSVLLREREEGTLKRLFALPISRNSILLGKTLAVAIVGLAQMMVLMIYGELLFRVGLFSFPGTLAIIVIAWVAVGSTFALMIATLSKSSKQADGMSTIIILVMAALGGCWFPVQLFNFPAWLDFCAKCMPTFWSMTCFQAVLWNKLTLYDSKIQSGLLAQCGFTLVFGLIAIWAYRRNYCRDR